MPRKKSTNEVILEIGISVSEDVLKASIETLRTCYRKRFGKPKKKASIERHTIDE